MPRPRAILRSLAAALAAAPAVPRALFLSLLITLPARAQPLTFDLTYTLTAPPSSPNLRAVTLTYAPPPATTFTLSAPSSLATLDGADGMLFTPDGDLLIAGGASAGGNRLHKLRLRDGQVTTLPTAPGVGLKAVAALALDPAISTTAATAYALADGGAAFARVPLAPFAQGALQPITGPDLAVSHLAFTGTNAYYVASGGAAAAGSFGTINLSTGATTRLLTNLPAARHLVADPYTGHLILFGRARITQISVTGPAPIIVSDLDLSAQLAGVDLRSGAADGRGRLIAASATGHLILVDFAASRLVAHPANTVRTILLEPGLEALAPLSGLGAPRAAECLWHTGDFDRRDGQLSALSPLYGDARTADDFALCPGAEYAIDSLSATVFTDAHTRSARLEIYDDCNGVPANLLHTFTVPAANFVDTGEDFFGLSVLRIEHPTPGLVLEGGRTYWLSVIGIGALSGQDQWYWGTAGLPSTNAPNPTPPAPGDQGVLQGRPAAFLSPALGVHDWTGVDLSGCGCTDFAFTVRGRACKVLRDNGRRDPAAPGLGAPSLINTAASDARAADDFVTPTCTDARVCSIEADVYTNCSPLRAVVEIYADACPPAALTPLFRAPLTSATDLNTSVSLGGETLRAQRLRFDHLDWFLPRGRNYWLAVVPVGGGSFRTKGYVAYSARCNAPAADCLVQGRPGIVRGQALGLPGSWASVRTITPGNVARDLAFTITYTDAAAPPPADAPPTPPPACPVDTDENGELNADDIFLFLEIWFEGCP